MKRELPLAKTTPRRSILMNAGRAAAAISAGTLISSKLNAADHRLSQSDVAILQFLAAVEIIKSDLWQQYDRLGGVSGGNAAYQAALGNIDDDMRSTLPVTLATRSATRRF